MCDQPAMSVERQLLSTSKLCTHTYVQAWGMYAWISGLDCLQTVCLWAFVSGMAFVSVHQGEVPLCRIGPLPVDAYSSIINDLVICTNPSMLLLSKMPSTWHGLCPPQYPFVSWARKRYLCITSLQAREGRLCHRGIAVYTSSLHLLAVAMLHSVDICELHRFRITLLFALTSHSLRFQMTECRPWKMVLEVALITSLPPT